jgi:hypothetical protein
MLSHNGGLFQSYNLPNDFSRSNGIVKNFTPVEVVEIFLNRRTSIGSNF